MNSLFPTRTKAAAVLRSPLTQLLSVTPASRGHLTPRLLFPSAKYTPTTITKAPTTSVVQTRWLHAEREKKSPEVPSPTPFVPDVKTFLTLIGRDLSKHVEKFPSWEALFTLNSEQLQELGIEPPRTRRYLIQWRHKFANGVFGIGGDLEHVHNGKAELRVMELKPRDPGRPPARVVVNVPPGKQPRQAKRSELVRVKGFKVRKANIIFGPYALPQREDLGGGAYIKVQEGMWEHRRGHKVDGGERRKTETRFLKRVALRREKREARMAKR